MNKFERALKACASDVLGLMAESIPDGFTELDEEELIVQIEQLSNRLVVDQFSPEESIRFDELLQKINESYRNWSSVKGRREKRQKSRRVILGSLRDFYVKWCLDNSLSETTPPQRSAPRLLVADQGVRPRMGQIINSCAVKPIPGVYVLGCFDHKKTIHTQQRRAVALVNSLAKFDEINSTTKVAVIGGGVGGITAARAAASKGASVSLFEKQEGLAPIQVGNTQRIVHPHIYDWPEDGSVREFSELPFLNWSAGVCKDVFSTIIEEFREYVKSTTPDKIRIKDDTNISSVGVSDPVPGRSRVEVSSDDGTIHEFFDIVLVAVGFGLETRSADTVAIHSYWQDDNLEQVVGYTKKDPEVVLISGSGDGALIDCLRAKLLNFDQSHLLEIIEPFCTPEFCQEIIDIEEEARQLRLLYPHIKYNYYSKYETSLQKIDFSKIFREKIKVDREVHLNFKGPEIFSQGSSPLNRVLVYGLVKSGNVKLQRGDLNTLKLVVDPSGRLPIKFSDHKDPVLYHRVVVRHGINGKHLEESIPSLWAEAQKALSSIRELELTSNIDNDLIFID